MLRQAAGEGSRTGTGGWPPRIQGFCSFFPRQGAHTSPVPANRPGGPAARRRTRAMKRSFRVATAFTGIAACTAGFVPAAQAYAVAADCPQNGAYASAVHLYYSTNEGHPDPACIRIVSNWNHPSAYFNPVRIASWCGGAYSGSVLVPGERQGRHFTAGSRAHHFYNTSVDGVVLSQEPRPGTKCTL